jgi:threonylcarbamoyladenosine tRNA methylthiotransferase MtaB
MKASIHTLGCRLNQYETALIEDRLREAGYALVPFGGPADLGIVNTCTVTREADAKCRQAVRSFIRRNPRAYMAVIGCYSQLGYKALAEIKGVDLILGTQEKLDVLEYVALGKNESPLIVRNRIQRDDFAIQPASDAAVTRRTNLKIQDGCNFMCSYCAIPFARGRSRSREMDNLVDEACTMVRRGARELILTGVNLGCYNHEGDTIIEVVARLNAIEGLTRIRISSIEPTTIPEDLFAMMDDPEHALVPYLHIPLQSGSNRILKAMKRKYTAEEFLEFVRLADRSVGDLCIGTDVMVGFPGESDEDFEGTVRLLEEGPVAYAHVFKYSEREGAASARIPGKVDPKVMSARSARLRRLAGRKRKRFFERHLGTSMEVLFEQEEVFSKEEEAGYWSGYTGNYMRVLARSQYGLKNEIRSVKLRKISGDFVLGDVDD